VAQGLDPELVGPTAGVAVGKVKGVAASAGARASFSSSLHVGDFDLELGCPRRDQSISFFDRTTIVTEGSSLQQNDLGAAEERRRRLVAQGLDPCMRAGQRIDMWC
jgi:hypothetical protein